MAVFTLHRSSHVAWQELGEEARRGRWKEERNESSVEEERNIWILVCQTLFYPHQDDTHRRALSLSNFHSLRALSSLSFPLVWSTNLSSSHTLSVSGGFSFLTLFRLPLPHHPSPFCVCFSCPSFYLVTDCWMAFYSLSLHTLLLFSFWHSCYNPSQSLTSLCFFPHACTHACTTHTNTHSSFSSLLFCQLHTVFCFSLM